MNYASTLVVSKFQKKADGCNTCSSLEILKNLACNSTCLADTRSEREMIAQKLIKSLDQNFDVFLEKGLDHKHMNYQERVNSIEEKISELYEEKRNNKSVGLRRYENNLQSSSLVDKRLRDLEQKMIDLEYGLSLNVAEHYDNFDTAHTIPLEVNEFDPAVGLYHDDLNDQLITLEKLKHLNNSHEELINNLFEESNFEQKMIAFKEEWDEFKLKIDTINNQLKNIQEMQDVLYKKIKDHYDSIAEIKEKLNKMKEKEKSFNTLSLNSLINAAENIFKGYHSLKHYQSQTKTNLNSHLKLLQTIPQLRNKAQTFSAELSKLM
ncbi:unnamed protein product [Blepharisma stoltei]|uniref:Uncharacterized protein n=1 Tax=Blepharisma stoltei TaxID=1481888 RepID=A0AAU9K3K5_9CILI|nr:unnamed protein product [Blepharisma stoltei]